LSYDERNVFVLIKPQVLKSEFTVSVSSWTLHASWTYLISNSQGQNPDHHEEPGTNWVQFSFRLSDTYFHVI